MFIKRKLLVVALLLNLVNLVVSAQVTPETALDSYINNGDRTYQWEEKESFSENGLNVNQILLTSQTWQGIVWKHQLVVITPEKRTYDGALLFVTGGSVKNGEPNWSTKTNDGLLRGLMRLAYENEATVALIKQVPNQPLYDELREDALISYTLHKFKQDNNFSWPLLFPMVKSAVRGMDAVQEFSRKKYQHNISRFTVSGASKRGWTSWLTGAIMDARVEAIGPMVIDILNMPASLDYQIKTWGDYSVEINDYVKLGIPQSHSTPGGKAITTMVDPYSYKERLTVPKMIFMGTNDPYWVVDNIKNYYKDIPGKNLLHYVPNAGHDLAGGEQAIQALGGFWAHTLRKKDYPECSWDLKMKKKNAYLNVTSTRDKLLDVTLWSADSKDKDFRDDKWAGVPVSLTRKPVVKIRQPLPASGYRAFYADLKYQAPNGQNYTTSTRVFVADPNEVFVD